MYKMQYFEQKIEYNKTNVPGEHEQRKEYKLLSECVTDNAAVAAGFLRALANKLDPPKGSYTN